MTRLMIMAVLLPVLAFVSPSWAELDLDKEVLVVPDTHDVKPYIWNVERNPKGYELVMDSGTPADGRFSFEVRQETADDIQEMHIFVTDSDLHFFQHLRPLLSGGRYTFTLEIPRTDTYRFEIVFRTGAGWMDLKKDIKLKGGNKIPDNPERDAGYAVKVKLIPRKVYAEHVVTFLFDLTYKESPVRDIEKMEGTDMQLASWDEDLREFIYATARQSFGGPEVAVSAVFMKPGKRAVFAEFRHRGGMRKIDFVIDVLAEPRQHDNAIENIRPSSD